MSFCFFPLSEGEKNLLAKRDFLFSATSRPKNSEVGSSRSSAERFKKKSQAILFQNPLNLLENTLSKGNKQYKYAHHR